MAVQQMKNVEVAPEQLKKIADLENVGKSL